MIATERYRSCTATWRAATLLDLPKGESASDSADEGLLRAGVDIKLIKQQLVLAEPPIWTHKYPQGYKASVNWPIDCSCRVSDQQIVYWQLSVGNRDRATRIANSLTQRYDSRGCTPMFEGARR